ncbi:Arm DNA-binding domain-containing protein [Labilibaculum antarcticum]|uniref:Arm DNA-binding domain-containing protein n=1 Tax=Labilibaculum antarcticum TaxID=1717717 RepID=UPI0037439873
MNTFSALNISFLIRKNRSNKQGEAPIYMRISVDVERKRVPKYRHPFLFHKTQRLFVSFGSVNLYCVFSKNGVR